MAKRSLEIMSILNNIISSDEEEELSIQTRKKKKFLERKEYLTAYDGSEFIKRFRLSKEMFLFVLAKIENDIKTKTERNDAVRPTEMLLLTLRFYATGSYLLTAGDFSGVSVTTASRIVKRVSLAIAKLAPEFIKMPRTDSEIQKTKSMFYNIAKFPKVIGCIDCTHVRIQSPGGENAEIFRNRKGYFSINVQAVCNANLEIIDLVCRWPGSAHDSNIFRNSRLKARFEAGDSGYGVSSYMMTPLSNTQREEEILYNESQIRTRNAIERSFGVWKRRFPILSIGIRVCLDTTMAIVVACGVLHNIARLHNETDPPIEEDVVLDVDNEMEEATGELANSSTNANTSIRSTLIREYFARL